MTGITAVSKANRVRRSQLTSTGDSHTSSQSDMSFDQGLAASGGGSTDDHQVVSKFIEAMKNPNWRKRSSQNESSELNQSELVGYHAALKKRKPERSPRSTESDGQRDSGEPDTWDLLYNHNLRKSYQDTDSVQAEKSFSDEIDEDHSDRVESKGLCAVTMHRSYKREGVKFPVHVIELVPFFGEKENAAGERHRYSQSDLVEIKRVSKNASARKCPLQDDGQNEQLAAALQAVDRTPPKVKRFPQQRASVDNDTFSSSAQSQSDRLREVILRDPAVADVSRLKNDVTSSKPSQAGNQKKPLAIQGEPQQASDEKSTNAAFNKMLEKLHRREVRGLHHAIDARDKAQNGKISRPLPPLPSEWNKIDKRDGRNTNSSDSGYASMPPTHGTTRLESASNTFNPRAREFLSFTGSVPDVIEENRHQNFRRVPIGDLFGKQEQETREEQDPSRKVSTSNDNIPVPNPPPAYQASSGYNGTWPDKSPPFMGAANLSGILSAASPMAGLNPFLNVPSNCTGTWGHGQAPNFQTPLQMAAPGGTWPGGLPLSSMLPAMVNSVQLPMPVGSTMFIPESVSQPPVATMIAPFSSCAQPYAVPKPRKPDPRNQQAYEAWIEWRKANEPGYAMECKQRQQRRAQRNIAGKSSSESVTKSEAAITA